MYKTEGSLSLLTANLPEKWLQVSEKPCLKGIRQELLEDTSMFFYNPCTTTCVFTPSKTRVHTSKQHTYTQQIIAYQQGDKQLQCFTVVLYLIAIQMPLIVLCIWHGYFPYASKCPQYQIEFWSFIGNVFGTSLVLSDLYRTSPVHKVCFSLCVTAACRFQVVCSMSAFYLPLSLDRLIILLLCVLS